MKRSVATVVLAAVVVLGPACGSGSEGDDGAVEATADESTATTEAGDGAVTGAALDCEELAGTVEAEAGEAPESVSGDGQPARVSTPLFEEQQVNCAYLYPGTGARVSVSVKSVEGGAADEDRSRWTGELTANFDADTGGQVLGPRRDDEQPEAVTVGDLEGAVYARSDGETATLYVLVDPETGLTVATTDYPPAATTDALVAIAAAALDQLT